MLDIKNYIREVPNWPKEGINFKDITPLLQDGKVFKNTIDQLAELYQEEKILLLPFDLFRHRKIEIDEILLRKDKCLKHLVYYCLKFGLL